MAHGVGYRGLLVPCMHAMWYTFVDIGSVALVAEW